MRRGAGGIVGILVVLWLVIGLVAAAQRGYFGDGREVGCKTVGDTVLTVLAGPLNYVGANPKIDCSDLPDETPEPSK